MKHTIMHYLMSLVLCAFAMFSTMAIAQEDSSRSVIERIGNYLESDIYRLELGFGSIELNNPDGFDVSTITYDTGASESTFFTDYSGAFTLSGEKAIGWSNRQKRLWTLHYDNDDFEGLKVTSLMAGAGVAISLAKAFAFGGRLAGGLGLGLTRSKTYFDTALHPAIEAWVSAGVQLGRFTLGITVRERATMKATLDERKASPRTTTRLITLGWLF